MMKLHLKLKYKKMIFAISVGTMAIGLAFLSINSKGDTEAMSNNVSSVSPSATPSGNAASGNDTQSTKPADSEAILKAKLEKNAYPEVNAIVKTYMEASVKADISTLENIVSEIDKLTKKELERRYEFIDSIKNIDCYTLPGLDEDS